MKNLQYYDLPIAKRIKKYKLWNIKIPWWVEWGARRISESRATRASCQATSDHSDGSYHYNIERFIKLESRIII